MLCKLSKNDMHGSQNVANIGGVKLTFTLCCGLTKLSKHTRINVHRQMENTSKCTPYKNIAKISTSAAPSPTTQNTDGFAAQGPRSDTHIITIYHV